MYNGIINIYKEKGYTSHDVVAVLRGILKMKRIGHTGTLDPEAEGVLPVCLGKATKMAEYLVDKEKTYVVSFRLGIATDTQDHTGAPLWTGNASKVDRALLKETADCFLGSQMQVPPMYSAVKVDGRKLYELARQGRTIERKARPVFIHAITDLSLEGDAAQMTVSCSKGTYIRTLCHDIGEALGCGAHMTALERIRSGPFSVEGSLTLDRVREKLDDGTLEEAILPIDSMFPEFPKVHVKAAYKKLLMNGNKLPADAMAEALATDKGLKYNVYDESGHYIGLYICESEEKGFKPVKLFI